MTKATPKSQNYLSELWKNTQHSFDYANFKQDSTGFPYSQQLYVAEVPPKVIR